MEPKQNRTPSPHTQLLLEHATAVFNDEASTNIFFQAARVLGHTDGLTLEQQALLVVPVLLNQLRSKRGCDTSLAECMAEIKKAMTTTPDFTCTPTAPSPKPDAVCRTCGVPIYINEQGDWQGVENDAARTCKGLLGHTPKVDDEYLAVRVVAPSTCRHCTIAIYKNEYGDWLATTNGTRCISVFGHEPVERPVFSPANCKHCGAIIENIGGMVWVAEEAQPCNKLVGHQPREAEV